MNEKVGIRLENDWLAKNKIEVNLLYEYDYNQSMLISSPKKGNKNIQVSFYQLRYDPIEKICFIDRKVKEITFSNRQEIKLFIKTMHTVASPV